MNDSPVVLDPGNEGDVTTGDGWRPQITLEHDAQRSELYVNVGEETAGMIEGVSAANWEAIKGRLTTLPADWVPTPVSPAAPSTPSGLAERQAAERELAARDEICPHGMHFGGHWCEECHP